MEPNIKNMMINEYLDLPPPHPCFLPVKTYLEDCLVSTNDVDNINDLEKEEAQVKDGDDGDICDIIREFLIPNIPDVMDNVIQPLIPKTIYTMPLDEDCVASATKPILDELLEEFREEILNITMVDEEADFNPTKDIVEP
uniref:Uncharacterized protein n=1 Tax=Tanacetum cinerariifolium TaxID=118510 RepID=A0A6L2JUJ8_TANCI|nr:hypothetical protein [Tanacetum cinerariifolium]